MFQRTFSFILKCKASVKCKAEKKISSCDSLEYILLLIGFKLLPNALEPAVSKTSDLLCVGWAVLFSSAHLNHSCHHHFFTITELCPLAKTK